VGDGAVHDALDAGVSEDRHPLHDLLEVGRDAVELRLEQLVVRLPARALAAPGLLGVEALVDADQAGLLLLAVVGRRPRVTHDGDLAIAVHELLHGTRHHVLVLQVREACRDAQPGADLVRVAARSVDHVLGGDVALLRADQELAGGQQLDAQDAVLADDGAAQLRRGLRHRVAGRGWVDVAVVERPGDAQDTFRGHERVDATGLVRPDDLHPEPDVGGNAFDPLEVVKLHLVHREAQAPRRVPAGRLAGHGLQLRVQVVGEGVDLGQVVVGDEGRTLARGVPRGAGGELALLDQDDVGPALNGEAVQEADAHDAPADDHDARLRLHGVSSGLDAATRLPVGSPSPGRARAAKCCLDLPPDPVRSPPRGWRHTLLIAQPGERLPTITTSAPRVAASTPLRGR